MNKRVKVTSLAMVCLMMGVLAGCDVEDGTGTLLIEPKLELQRPKAVTYKEAVDSLTQLYKKADTLRSGLGKIANRARETDVSPSDVDASLNSVIAFISAVSPDGDVPSEAELLELYYNGEVLKAFATEYNAQPLHELGNWVNAYISGELTGDMVMTDRQLYAHRDSLIEKAQTKWASIYHAD